MVRLPRVREGCQQQDDRAIIGGASERGVPIPSQSSQRRTGRIRPSARLLEGGAIRVRSQMSKAPKKAAKRGYVRHTSTDPPSPAEFDEVLRLIDAARTRAVAAVNTTLIELYWSIGEDISRKIESAAWGEGVVDQLASHLARRHPGLRGYTRANLFRMRQFYETYRGDEKVSALLRQLPWTHNLLILGKSKRAEEREFYLRMSISEKWSKRELERQIAGALFERVVLSPTRISPPVRQLHPDVPRTPHRCQTGGGCDVVSIFASTH